MAQVKRKKTPFAFTVVVESTWIKPTAKEVRDNVRLALMRYVRGGRVMFRYVTLTPIRER